jgi:hypothetical protein
VFNNSTFHVYFWGNHLFHWAAWIPLNGGLMVLYWANIPAVEKFKTEATVPWPFRHPV